ncbi:MAG: hypothetical protein ABS918_02910 [Saccharopolyspora rectivirgula]
MHEGSRSPRRVRLPAVVVCAVLGTAVAFLVAVSLLVPGPEQQNATQMEGIVTSVTPAGAGSPSGPSAGG